MCRSSAVAQCGHGLRGSAGALPGPCSQSRSRAPHRRRKPYAGETRLRLRLRLLCGAVVPEARRAVSPCAQHGVRSSEARPRDLAQALLRLLQDAPLALAALPLLIPVPLGSNDHYLSSVTACSTGTSSGSFASAASAAPPFSGMGAACARSRNRTVLAMTSVR